MHDKHFITVTAAARHLGLPVAWLQREVREGRVPHVRADRRILVKIDAIEAALIDRAKTDADGKATGVVDHD
jgi:hypothetical protein